MRRKCKKLYEDDEIIWCVCSHPIDGWKPLNVIGGDKTWWVCDCCGLPSKFTLNQCDTCDMLWRGPYPFKFAVTCPSCEDAV